MNLSLCFEPQTRVQSLLDENDFFFICRPSTGLPHCAINATPKALL